MLFTKYIENFSLKGFTDLFLLKKKKKIKLTCILCFKKGTQKSKKIQKVKKGIFGQQAHDLQLVFELGKKILLCDFQ